VQAVSIDDVVCFSFFIIQSVTLDANFNIGLRVMAVDILYVC